MNPQVAIVLGSDSDLPVMQDTASTLQKFGVPFEISISSAHRSPARTMQYVAEAEAKGVQVFIAAAGMAAHLAGVIAAHTTCPVIGVPMDGSALSGVDALYSTVQMPAGIPVATVAIGKAGARNAAILAMQILALRDEMLQAKLTAYKKELAKGVEKKAAKLAAVGYENYVRE